MARADSHDAGSKEIPPQKEPKEGKEGKKSAAKKENKDVEFLVGVEVESGATGKGAKDTIKKVVSLLTTAVDSSVTDVFVAACDASCRVCKDAKGFQTFFKAGGVETLMLALKDNTFGKDKSASKALKEAIKESCKATTAWFSEMDYVDFKEMGNFTYLSCWLCGQDENLSLEVLELIDRSGRMRIENCAALIQGGAFAVLHKIISAHRAPELVEEALGVMYHLCDLPPEASEEYMVPYLQHEQGLVSTVVESLNSAPLNLRLQLTGLRLLAIWARHPSHEVRALLRKAEPAPALDGTVEKLSKGGFPHTAAWVSAIAARPLATALAPEEQQRAKLSGVDG